ncbi:6-phosphofructokinase [Patescibacteria group bacterium]|nr:6-phosphofructokinase [Patescibacteria group bacterium]MBU1124009.1 6-phosphofructokinase [Patescibacteria group bacterium]MBU1911370.1 6-phosphofructokinase [Patescibacteria group bacterium]
MEKDRIGIACAGGKSPGWPAGIKAITDVAENAGLEAVGIEFGFEGLVVPNADFKNIHYYGDQKDFLCSNASPIFRSRYTPFNKNNGSYEADEVRDARALMEFMESEEKGIIEDNIKRNRLRHLILMGGDDSLWTLKMLMEAGIISGCLVPKTIDNDLTETLSHGHISAGQAGRDFVDQMRIEARDDKRIMVVESMGRYAAHLAMQHYNADIVLPAKEIEITKEQVQARVLEVFNKNGTKDHGDPNKGHGVLVVAEGFLIDGEETFKSQEEDDHGHKRLGDVGRRVKEWIEEIGIASEQVCPSYLYRTCCPVPECSALTQELAAKSTSESIRGNAGISSVARNRSGGGFDVSWMPLSEISGGKLMSPDHYNLDQLMPKSDKLRAE